MEDMIRQAVRCGLEQICFTEHQDFDYPPSHELTADFFLVDTDAYLQELLRLRQRYAGQIRLGFGIELGLQTHLTKELTDYVHSHTFDFIIGSSHVCNRQDPYYPEFFEGRSEEAAYREYFTDILENIKCFQEFDVYGHLDYVVRYGPSQDREYTYEKYRDILDAILELLLASGKGLEINTGGLKYGLREPNPCTALLKRYRQLGGEIITVGSDAHVPRYIGYEFAKAAELLKSCGFSHYTTFQHRPPEFHKL
jgi:histidinol-phosphatase (PHP family)